MQRCNFRNIFLGSLLVILGACSQEFKEITTLPIKRCLEPMKLQAKVDRVGGKTTTFSWTVTADAERYELEILLADDQSTAKAVTLGRDQVPYVTDDLTLGNKYTFRVRGIADGKEPSKWAQYEKTFTTFVPKDPISFTVAATTSNSISVSWSKELEDYRDVSSVEAQPVAGGATVKHETTADETEAAFATVDGLEPSTQYYITLVYQGAVRASVSAWTQPDASQAVTVTTADEFAAAIENGAQAIAVPYGNDVIKFGEVSLHQPLTLLGVTGPAGEKPVLVGHFRLYEGASSLNIQSVEFNTEGSFSYGRLIELKEAVDGLSVNVVNSDVLNYKNGIFYDNFASSHLNVSFNGVSVINAKAGVGDFFDVRSTSTYDSISFSNCTFSNSGRDIFRVDKATVSTFEVLNCTFNNLAASGNNIFYVRGNIDTFNCANCLFLNEEGRRIAKSASDVLPKFSNCWFFNCMNPSAEADDFLNGVAIAKLTANGGGVVTTSPCKDADNGDFTLENEDLADKNVGDPRWITL